MPKRIIVAGIYRSGTSLTSELIHRWGAYAGREEDIFKDEYGSMEHLALQKLNDELLNNNSRVPTPADQLIQNPQQECARLCHFLDTQCEISSEDAVQRINSLSAQISVKKHHFQHPQALAEVGTTTREQRALFNFLRVKTMYPDEVFNNDDFAIYPGWREYLQVIDMLVSSNAFNDTQKS